MDAKGVLDSMLIDGKQIAAKGLNQAEQHLNLPDSGPERDAMIDGMQKGALAAGALAILLGTRTGRRVGEAALKVGSVAAVGGLAYNAWQRWQENVQSGAVTKIEPADTGTAVPISELDGDPLQSRSIVLLRTMIAAARADGHIDAAEKKSIMEKMGDQQLDDDVLAFLRTEIESEVSPEALAALADSAATGHEMYLAARIIIDTANDKEAAWLEQFRNALDLPAGLVSELEQQVT